MSTHTLALSCGGNQIAGAVIELDGQDISNAVGRVSVEMRAGDIPRAVLYVSVGTTADLGEVTAHIPAEAHDLLVKLGWTPPEEP